MTDDKDEATNKDEAGHRHRWIDNTRIEDVGTRYECTCGATYFEPMINNKDLVYLRESTGANEKGVQRSW